MNIHLIADENISWRIKKIIPKWNILPANEIRKDQRLSDILIWEFAKENQYTILTFQQQKNATAFTMAFQISGNACYDILSFF